MTKEEFDGMLEGCWVDSVGDGVILDGRFNEAMPRAIIYAMNNNPEWLTQ